MRRRARERQEKREDRPILNKLRAAHLRSFRGLHGKKMVYVRGVPGVTGTLGKANSHFNQTQTGRGSHHHVEAAVDSCSSILLALHVQYIIYYIYDRNFALHYPKRSASIRVLSTNRRFVMMIRVKVNSKSELVENREGKSALYSVICCCDDRLLSRAVIWNHTV